MATVNFSVPEDVKRRRAQRRAAAVDALLKLRRRQRPITDREMRKARRIGRP